MLELLVVAVVEVVIVAAAAAERGPVRPWLLLEHLKRFWRRR